MLYISKGQYSLSALHTSMMKTSENHGFPGVLRDIYGIDYLFKIVFRY